MSVTSTKILKKPWVRTKRFMGVFGHGILMMIGLMVLRDLTGGLSTLQHGLLALALAVIAVVLLIRSDEVEGRISTIYELLGFYFLVPALTQETWCLMLINGV